MLTGAGVWELLKIAEQKYLGWRDEQRKYEPYLEGRRPVKQGNLHVYNRFRDEVLLVDFRVFVDRGENYEAYRVRSCMIQIDETDFETADKAFNYLCENVRERCDECGFALEIIDIDDDRVEEFDPQYSEEELELIVPKNTDQQEWNH